MLFETLACGNYAPSGTSRCGRLNLFTRGRRYDPAMPPAYDPSNVVLPSEERARAIEATLMFSRRTIRLVYVGANAVGVALILWSRLNRTALLTPVAPDFRAFMIGLGVFLGVLVATVEREAWLLGFGGRRAPSRGVFTAIAMAALVVASGFGGDFVARKLWEWRAFHGLRQAGVDHVFTVVSRYDGRGGDSLELQDPSAARRFSITCSYRTYLATRVGDRLILPVETGRGGARRVTLPAPQDLRRD